MKNVVIEGCQKEKGINKIVNEWRGAVHHGGNLSEQDAAYIGHLVTRMLIDNNNNISLVRIFIS